MNPNNVNDFFLFSWIHESYFVLILLAKIVQMGEKLPRAKGAKQLNGYRPFAPTQIKNWIKRIIILKKESKKFSFFVSIFSANFATHLSPVSYSAFSIHFHGINFENTFLSFMLFNVFHVLDEAVDGLRLGFWTVRWTCLNRFIHLWLKGI